MMPPVASNGEREREIVAGLDWLVRARLVRGVTVTYADGTVVTMLDGNERRFSRDGDAELRAWLDGMRDGYRTACMVALTA